MRALRLLRLLELASMMTDFDERAEGFRALDCLLLLLLIEACEGLKLLH